MTKRDTDLAIKGRRNKPVKTRSFDDEKLFKFLLKCNRAYDTPDLHSFTAKIKDGTVYVECRGYETYVESIIFDKSGNEKKSKFVGTAMAATNLLERLELDFDSIEV